MGQLIDARTAAARLGVDVRTLYAYVSRGALRRVPGPDGRSSRYDADELDLLARRSRPRTLPRPAASIDLVIATQVSTVTDGLVRYRGTNVLDLVAADESFEAVADRLWAPSGARAGTWAAARTPPRCASRAPWTPTCPSSSGSRPSSPAWRSRRRAPPVSRCAAPVRLEWAGWTGRPGAGHSSPPWWRRPGRPGALAARTGGPVSGARTRTGRWPSGCGSAGHRCGPPRPGPGRSIPRWCCWPSTSWPCRPWPSGSRRPPGPRRPAACWPGWACSAALARRRLPPGRGTPVRPRAGGQGARDRVRSFCPPAGRPAMRRCWTRSTRSPPRPTVTSSNEPGGTGPPRRTSTSPWLRSVTSPGCPRRRRPGYSPSPGPLAGSPTRPRSTWSRRSASAAARSSRSAAVDPGSPPPGRGPAS